jgi:hypothetical protein
MENENIEFEEVQNEEEFSSLEDLETQFLKSPKVGEKVEFTVKGFQIVKERDELEFAFEKNGKQKTATNALSNVDYGIKFTTTDNAVFWVSSWGVWGQIKAIAKKLKTMTLKNVELQIDHVLDGMVEANRDKCWVVRVKVGEKWQSLNRESKEWE